ncbi:BZ3500_MvSof-1268-A1-R1_Chr4-3g07359 [Microbotryum saponariae]|uniref:BZ3500_MvSof-1268-A1-R1_Chr4-3g07359 protein n=1 Tax=Microbotryum saponariae TaxID=289078 RepID=A0A2X0NGX3_9BASI|nr:BZ3500_MvSof-1268-A1-R1_Chr4-3g07359 [Microbotryum saponariae]SDA07022.1 BZ3501_MvSof-1269-A2-R1_Chr4-2g07068 [Microbotryum saponariae]
MEKYFGVYRSVRKIGCRLFEAQVREVELFSGMKIATDEASGIMTFDQCHQIETILTNHGFVTTSAVCTRNSDSDLHANGGTSHLKLNCRQVVDELLWVSGYTRPDISYAVTQQAVERLRRSEARTLFRQMRRILPYLRGTTDRRLRYKRHLWINVTLYCHSDHAAEKSGRRSTSGYAVIMAGSAITWASKRQISVVTSVGINNDPDMIDKRRERLDQDTKLSRLCPGDAVESLSAFCKAPLRLRFTTTSSQPQRPHACSRARGRSVS